MAQEFSSIQNHILSKLKNASSLRYSELKPNEVPNDLFNYHLQFLVKKDFVLRADEGYSLSPIGVKHVADPFTDKDQEKKITSLFKVNVITIVSRINEGKLEILNQVRKSNPSYGKVGVMGGVVWKGEAIEVAAKRKLEAETGLSANFKLVGMERRMMYVNEELFSDVLFPVAYADEYEGELIEDTDFGHNMWVPIDQAIQNESAEFDSLICIKEALILIKDGTIFQTPFFFKETTQRG